MIPTPKSGLEVAAGCGLLFGCLGFALLFTAVYRVYGNAGAAGVLFLATAVGIIGAMWAAEMKAKGWKR